MPEEHLPILVYGTLKRGEERAGRWPYPPQAVEWATVQGRLRDLGPYPALVEGEGTVLGELWHVRPEHFAETLRVLDEIECFGNDDVDLYVRRIVDCRTLTGTTHRAYTYFFADPGAIRHVPLVQPDAQGFCKWSRARRASS